MRYRIWILVSSFALAGVAHAGEEPTRAEGIGMLSGAAGGALLGGPPGAILGLALGAFVGDRVHVANAAATQAASLESELTVTRSELTEARSELAATRLALARAASEAVDREEASFLQELAERLGTDVLFRTASHELDSSSAERLQELANVLASIDDIVIELHGFADPRGEADWNRDLSERRAARVRAALVEGGIDPARVRVIAHGEELSTAVEGDREAYAWERRVRLGVVVDDDSRVARAEPEPR